MAYLVTGAHYSGYCEPDQLLSIQSSVVIQAREQHFGRIGMPHTLITDNGPQFTSELFKGFARKYGFNHIASKLGPDSLTSTSLFPHAHSRSVGHGGHRELKMWPQNPFSNGGKIAPARVGGKWSSFVIQIPKFASMALLSQQLLSKWSSQKETWKLLLSGGTKPCLVIGNKQLFLEVLWKVLVQGVSKVRSDCKLYFAQRI